MKGRVNRWVGHDEWNNEECKMILFGPFNASLQEVRWCLPQGECFQVSEAICKDGNVGNLEEPLTGLSEWVPSEAIILSYLFHCGGRLSDLNGKEKWKCS